MIRQTSCLFATVLLAGSMAFADQWNKKTILTVNETIMVPGANLEPGKYVVKLVDSLSDRHIVQITNEREDHVYTTILAIPNYRLKPTGKSAFQWWETPRGNPPAMRAWFYPGDNFGQEFAYPKGLSAKIAQSVQQPVPTITAETPAELKTAPLTATAPSGKQTPFVFPIAPVAPKPAPELRAEARPAPEPPAAAPQPEPVQTPAVKELPATGSPFAAYGVAGLIALAAGLALRTAAKAS
jgi:hypothetical protein